MTDLVEETNKYWFKAKYLREKNEPITEIKPDNSESNPSESQSTVPSLGQEALPMRERESCQSIQASPSESPQRLGSLPRAAVTQVVEDCLCSSTRNRKA